MYVVIETDMEYGGCCSREYIYKVFGPFTKAAADDFVAAQSHKIDFRIEKLEDES